MTAELIEQALRKQISAIGEATSRVKAGIIMNISDVEIQVAMICSQISTLPEGEGQKLEQIMAEMIGKLEELAAALSEFKDRNSHGDD